MSPRQDMLFGTQAGLRAPSSAMDGSPAQRAALDALLRRVRALEETEAYRDMCAAADARVRATAAAAGAGSPSAGGNRPAATGEAQGRSSGSAAVQASPTSEQRVAAS